MNHMTWSEFTSQGQLSCLVLNWDKQSASHCWLFSQLYTHLPSVKLLSSIHVFQSCFSSTNWKLSLVPETRFELTSQSQTGFSQSSQPSKQLAPLGQSGMIYNFNSLNGRCILRLNFYCIIIAIQNAFNRNDFASIFTSHIQILYPS